MMSNYRKVYDFFLPWHKKYLNRLGYKGRFAIALTALTFVAVLPIIKEGLKNGRVIDLRHDWIRKKVRDINNSDFASLDEEEPPRPLPAKSNIQLFREEFVQVYSKAS